MNAARKTAIVMINLGGPDKRESIRPFLQNLFDDPAIVRAPGPVRWFLARLISRTRAPAVAKNYALMNQPGGGSPLLPETEKKARVLEEELSTRHPDRDIRCFIAMRYWHPLTEETAEEVRAWGADEVVILPLYPQYSSTTTGSSLTAWRASYGGPTKVICCYPLNADFLTAHVEAIERAWREAGEPENVSLLMSAHGLPERIVEEGDPYQWQIEEVARRLSERLPEAWDKRVCYQSRLGPLKWIGPSTDEEIERAARAGRHIIVSPIAFTSDHIETLVELGVEYREIAEENGVAGYTTVPALATAPLFIKALADEVDAALGDEAMLRSCAGGRICPKVYTDCPFTEEPL